MPYADRFTATDNLITHLQPIIGPINDAAILANYAGFLSVSAITVYELAIKDIFTEFAQRKHSVFGNFTEKHFARISGHIFIRDITGKHIELFGSKYRTKFSSLLTSQELLELAASGTSITNSYGNLVQCRHDFVHKGVPTLTVNEVMSTYEHGKKVLHCLDGAMRR